MYLVVFHLKNVQKQVEDIEGCTNDVSMTIKLSSWKWILSININTAMVLSRFFITTPLFEKSHYKN